MARDARVISILTPLEKSLLMRGGFLVGLILLFIFLATAISQTTSQEPEQTIDEFNLSGFGKAGTKSWEISGKSADIFRDEIKLQYFIGTAYNQEKITVIADRGNFNKVQDKVHLENNVVITTESGAELTTDYLDWYRDASQVETTAPVDITRDNIVVSGIGIKGDTQLKNIDLERDVKVQIDEQKNKIVITCVGPLNINYADNIAVFNKDVFVDDGQSQIYADLMEVFFKISQADDLTNSIAGKTSRIKKIIARGNVKIVRQDNISLSQEAIYNADNKTLTLSGRPKLIIYSAEDIDASTGN